MANPQLKPIHALLWHGDRSLRTLLQRRTTLRDAEGKPTDVVLENLSLTGFRMSSTEPLASGQSIMIGLEGVGVRSAKVVWVDDDVAGCEFDHPITDAEMDGTIHANVIVENRFGSSEPSAEPQVEIVNVPYASSRRRFTIVLGAAIVSWGMIAAIATGLAALLA